MNKYVVAFCDETQSDIVQQIVEATSMRDAALKYLAQFQDITFDEDDLLYAESYDLVQDHIWDYYSASISAIEIYSG